MMLMRLAQRSITGTDSIKKRSQRLSKKAIPNTLLQKGLTVTFE